MRAFDQPSRPERTITVNYDGFAEGTFLLSTTNELTDI